MTRMIRTFALLVVIALLTAGSAALAVRAPKAVGPTYTPLQLLHSSQLQGAKTGQAFQVRGILYLWQIGLRGTAFFLFGGPKVGSGGLLVVFAGPPNPVASTLRRWPVIGPRIPPTADHPIVNKLATYRVKVIACLTTCSALPRFQLTDGGAP